LDEHAYQVDRKCHAISKDLKTVIPPDPAASKADGEVSSGRKNRSKSLLWRRRELEKFAEGHSRCI
jgi:hypothetical protein